MRIGNIEITLRESIIVIFIFGMTTIIGFFIAGNIYDSSTEDNEKYFKALKVDNDAATFKYALETEVGNLISYGKVSTPEPVTSKDLDGKYYSIKRVTERYTQHTREESYKCGKNTCYRTEVYWTWDVIDTDETKAKEFKFLGETFKSDLVDLTNNKYNDTVSAGFHLRYQYYTTPVAFSGSMYSKAKDKTIKNNEFYHDKKIKELTGDKEKEADNNVLIFWILWSILGLALGFGFTVLDNKFLNGGR